METPAKTTSHGGILFQLDMFRPTLLASVLAEGLVSKARNILNATLEIARHPTAPIAIARLHGSILDDDPAEFWRENADLALYASQVLPRQCFIYYVRTGLNRREGFIVAQRGQVLVAHDATPETLPASTQDNQWPVARLCEQMRLRVDELAAAFPGGPRVTLSLAEPSGDDQKMLMILAGQADADVDADAELADEALPPEDGDDDLPPAPAPGPRAAAGKRAGVSVEDDARRRAAERAAEEQAMEARAQAARSDLPHVLDERGIVVAPRAELGEPEILAPFLVASVDGPLPDGLSERLRPQLQGKAIDFAVAVDFLSEVFLNNRPLGRADFEAQAQALDLGGTTVQALEVFAPRLGAGTLLRLAGKNAFISRRPGEPMPAALLLRLLGRD